MFLKALVIFVTTIILCWVAWTKIKHSLLFFLLFVAGLVLTGYIVYKVLRVVVRL